MANLRLKAFDAVSDLLLWVAFAAGIIGSFALTATKLGAAIGKTINILPVWIVVPAALLGIAMIVFDVKDDGLPNRLRTMYITVLWPSALLGVQGSLAKRANDWIHGMNTKLDDKVGPLISDNPKHAGSNAILTIIAVTCIAFALYTGHRYYSNKRAAGRAAGRTTVGTTPAAGGGRPIIANDRKGR